MLRERALVAALDGHGRRAQRLLARSLAEAERQGARYERALTLRSWGQVGSTLGWPGAEEARREADAELTELVPRAGAAGEAVAGISPTLSIADRFTTLPQVGRRIAAAPSPEAVFAALEDAAATLLRGERCHVLKVENGTRVSATTVSGEPVDLSKSLITRALESCGPVLLAEPPAEGSGDSIVLSGLRSALCAPICSEGATVACLYVTHSQVTGLFGPASSVTSKCWSTEAAESSWTSSCGCWASWTATPAASSR